MPKISPSQLRAARALLNWSRAELSKASGISEPTLHRFENGMNEPETRTANKLLEVFNAHGVEFSDHQGVCFKPNDIDVFDGVERFSDFYDFLYEHLNQFGGNVCVSIYDETILYQYRSGKDPYLHMKRMKRLFDQKKLLSFRILTTISHFATYGYAEFRWLPKQPASPTAFYAFGDCLALMSFVDEKSPHIVVIRSSSLAEGYRQGFNVAWQLGQKPPSAAEIAKMCRRSVPLPNSLK
ncbi:MAG: helix-turn-helix transcriptional regulator [Bdellovibrionales bacterium]